MSTTRFSPSGWGPERRPGAFSLTFDNMGEAADLELGYLGPDARIGAHFTGREFVPKLLAMVEQVPVTYFIEAFNVAHYPDAIRSIRDAGHEIGMHAWRHENWGLQSATARADILDRSLEAYASIGVFPKGFRPPGGVLPEGAVDEFAARGLTFASPLDAAGNAGFDGALAVMPFAWQHVDAYMLDPRLRALRARFGDPEDPVPFDQWARVLDDATRLAIEQRTHVTLVFHPFLFAQDPQMAAALQGLIRTLQSSRELWVARCGEVAQWMRSQHP